MYVIGINWKPVWKHVWKLVWKQPVAPTPIPPRTITRGGSLYGERYEEELWEEMQYQRWLIEVQNADDLEVVKVLTEFLSRI